ncbi:hypothetical protein O3G_MSEX001779 [Manduca sexta]|uniref:Uncharacterized protein n=1 Tax=Manduca sexta TaxID=7130 RepID=A0A921YL54_MANSE|nr:hypothetical protein O3G_MSEX001779 [Manduca sexta]
MDRNLNLCVLSYVVIATLITELCVATPLEPHYEIDSQSVQHIGDIPAAAYEYTIVPSSEYTLKENSTSEISLVDCILTPLTLLAKIGFNAVSIVKWILITFSPVLLGMSLVILFCAFTDYCTLTIEYPFSSDFTIGPYLDNVEQFVVESYNKYHNLQQHIL